MKTFLAFLLALSASGQPVPPDLPTNNAAALPATYHVNVAWDASAGADGYVFGVGGASNNYTRLLPTAATTLSCSNLVDGSNYWFSCRATNAIGSSDWATGISFPWPLTNTLSFSVQTNAVPANTNAWGSDARFTSMNVTNPAGQMLFFRMAIMQSNNLSAFIHPD